MQLKNLSTRTKIALLIPLLILTGILMYLFRDLARQIIAIPILYVVWAADLTLQIVPQPILWFLFLCVGTIILLISLLRTGKSSRQKRSRPPKDLSGKVTKLARLARFAGKWEYSRWNLAHYLAELEADILAFQEHDETQPIKLRLQEGNVEFPEEVRLYFQAGMGQIMASRPGVMTKLKHRLRSEEPEESPLDIDPRAVVDFLEYQLEGEEYNENA